MSVPDNQPFFSALGLRRGDAVALVGAGGKTSLLFRLATEGRALGLRVLVTTTTRMLVPESHQYDALDLSGKLFADQAVTEPGIYAGGVVDTATGKMVGVREDLLHWQQKHFDLLLIEADGAARKQLKGWRHGEPVVPDFTTATIGVLDIGTIGRVVNNELVHRMEIFCSLTGAEPGEQVAIGHLLRLIVHDEGLFAKASGRELLYLNKVESAGDEANADLLRSQLDNLKIVAGSVKQGTIHG